MVGFHIVVDSHGLLFFSENLWSVAVLRLCKPQRECCAVAWRIVQASERFPEGLRQQSRLFQIAEVLSLEWRKFAALLEEIVVVEDWS